MQDQNKHPKKKRTSLRNQRRAVIILAVAAVLLVVGLVVVNYLVAIYHYTDVDGTAYTIQKSDGKYVLRLDSQICDQNDSGYFLTKAGTQLEIDPQTGEYEIYAVVHTSDTEELSTNQRILLFKQLTYNSGSTKDTSRLIKQIEVHNQIGKMVFRRFETEDSKTISNYFYIEGHEDTSIDNTLFAKLASGCGHNLAERRLENPVRLPDGSVDFAEYGLVPETRTREDEEGNRETYEYTPTRYTVTTMTGDTYSVTLGDATVTGGYYARFTGHNGTGGRDTIYILNSANLDEAVLQSVETFVTPMVVFPMSANSYYDVENFTYFTDINYDGMLRDMVFELTNGELDLDLLDTDNPSEQKPPEIIDKINAVLKLLDEMSDEDYAAFYQKHYDANGRRVITFSYSELDDRANTLQSYAPYVTAEGHMKGYLPNADNITTNVLQKLYEASFVGVIKLAPSADDLAKYGLDEPAHILSFIYHDPGTSGLVAGDRYNQVQISDKAEDGLYYAYSPLFDMIVAMEESEAPYLAWDTIDWYEREYFQGGIVYTTDIRVESPLLQEPAHFKLDNSRSPLDEDGAPTLDNLRIYYNDIKKPIDYDVMVTKPGSTTPEKEDASYNFRRLYVTLVSGSLEETAKLTEEEMAALRAKDDSECLLKLTIFQDDGTGKEGGTRYLVYRFYQVTERRAYMTLEVLDTPDSPSDPQNAQGQFYVSAAFCKKIAADVQRFLNHEEVVNNSKF